MLPIMIIIMTTMIMMLTNILIRLTILNLLTLMITHTQNTITITKHLLIIIFSIAHASTTNARSVIL